MTGAYNVRPAVDEDAAAIVTWFPTRESAILWGGNDVPWPLHPSWLHRQFALESRRYYALVDDPERVCGTFSLRRISSERMHLGRFGVDPQLRRRGLGRLMLTTAIQMARDAQASILTLVVFVNNAPARALYEGCGFVPSSAQHDLDEDQMLMEIGLRE